MKTEYIDWLEFVDYWMDHCSTNGLSVVALDKENSRVAGVFIVRDLLMVPPGFDDKYKSETKTLSPWMGFLWHMDAEAIKKMPELGEPGKAVDLWFLGVHPDYRFNPIVYKSDHNQKQRKQDRKLPDQGCDGFAEEIQLQVRDNWSHQCLHFKSRDMEQVHRSVFHGGKGDLIF